MEGDNDSLNVIDISSADEHPMSPREPMNVDSPLTVIQQAELDAADALAWWETPVNWTIDEARAVEVKSIIGAQQHSTNLMDSVHDNHKSHVRRGASKFASADDVSLLMSSQPSPTTTMAFAKSVLPSEASMVPATLIGTHSLLLERTQMEGPLVCTRRTHTPSLGLDEGGDAVGESPPSATQPPRAQQQYKPYLDTTLSNSIHPDELVIPLNDADLGLLHGAPFSLRADGGKDTFDVLGEQRVYGCHLLSTRSFCHSQRLPNADKIFRRWSSREDDATATIKSVVAHTRYFHTTPPGDFGFIRSNFFCPEPYGLSSSGISQDPTVTTRDGAKHAANFHSDDFAAPEDASPLGADDVHEPSLLICRNGHVTCACCLLVHWIGQSLEQTSNLQFAKLNCPSCDATFSVNKFWRYIYAPRTVSTMLTLIHQVNGDYAPSSDDGTNATSKSSSSHASLMTSDFWPVGAATEKDDEFIYRPEVLNDQTSFHGGMRQVLGNADSTVAENVPSGRVFSWFMWRWVPLVHRTKKEWRKYVKRPDTFMWCPNAIPSFVVPSPALTTNGTCQGWWPVPHADKSTSRPSSSSTHNGRSIGFGMCRDVADFAKMAFHLIPFTDQSRRLLLGTMLDCAKDSFASVRRWLEEIVSSFGRRWTKRSTFSPSSQPSSASVRLTLFTAMSMASIGIGMEGAHVVDEHASTLLSTCIDVTKWELASHQCALFDMLMDMKCRVLDMAPEVKSFGVDAKVLRSCIQHRAMKLLVMTARHVSVMHAMRRFERACPCCGWLPLPLHPLSSPDTNESSMIQCASCLFYFQPMSNDVLFFKDETSLYNALNWSFQLVRYNLNNDPSGVEASQVQETMIESYRRYCAELNRHCSKNAVHFHLTPPSVSNDALLVERARICASSAFDTQTTLVMDGLTTFIGREHVKLKTSLSSAGRDDYVASTLGAWQCEFYARLFSHSCFSSLEA